MGLKQNQFLLLESKNCTFGAFSADLCQTFDPLILINCIDKFNILSPGHSILCSSLPRPVHPGKHKKTICHRKKTLHCTNTLLISREPNRSNPVRYSSCDLISCSNWYTVGQPCLTQPVINVIRPDQFII